MILPSPRGQPLCGIFRRWWYSLAGNFVNLTHIENKLSLYRRARFLPDKQQFSNGALTYALEKGELTVARVEFPDLSQV